MQHTPRDAFIALRDGNLAALEDILSTGVVDVFGEANGAGKTLTQLVIESGSESALDALLSAHERNRNASTIGQWRDGESGFSALHLDPQPCCTSNPSQFNQSPEQMLFTGRLRMAVQLLRRAPDLDLTLRDLDANTCFDLLDLTFDVGRVATLSTSKQSNRLDKQHQESDSDEDKDTAEQVEINAAFDVSVNTTTSLMRQLSIPSRKEAGARPPPLFSTSVWTWGSNSNLQLGHSNSNNRAFPERIDFAPHLHLKDPVAVHSLQDHHPIITHMSLSKYHTVISTARHVYTFGFGSGGRLGLGHQETTLLPSLVHGLEFLTGATGADDAESAGGEALVGTGGVRCLATGPDHTVVVTETGRVFTFGSNKWGQLGYVTDLVRDEMKPSLVPFDVGGALRKVKVVGAAASKYHTVVFSNTGLLFTWGWNIGQLGYQQAANTTQLQATPRKVTAIPHGEILAVAATNNSTAILINRGEVHVLSSHETRRVVFTPPPSPAPRTGASGASSANEFKTTGTVRAVKIASGNHQYVALTGEGDAYLWSPPVEVEEYKATWQQRNFPQTRPRRVWSVRRGAMMAARDVAVGIDSTLLIRTEGRHVYLGTRRKEVKLKESHGEHRDAIYFKFKQVPYLQNIQFVCASISGAYGAIRFDELPTPISPSPGKLREDLRGMMLIDTSNVAPDDGLIPVQGEPFADAQVVVACGEEHGEYAFDVHRVVLAARSPFFRRIFEYAATRMDIGDMGVLEGGAVHVSVVAVGESDDTDYVPPISSFEVNDAKDDAGTSVDEDPVGGGHRVVCVRLMKGEHVPNAVSSALELLYTGGYSRNWHAPISKDMDEKPKVSVRKSKEVLKAHARLSPNPFVATQSDFYSLVRLFELDQTECFSGSSLDRYCASFSLCLQDPAFMTATVDILLELAEGEQLFCHQLFLAARSPFFKAMLGSGSQWMLAKRTTSLPFGKGCSEASIVAVEMRHHTLEIMRIVMEWIYTDARLETLVAGLMRETLLEYLAVLIEILGCANEMLLERLKEQVSSLLGSLLDLTNVVEILEVADMYDAGLLRAACLDFVCWNLTTMIESHMLDDVSEVLLKDIELTLRTKQIQKFPFMRGPDGFYWRVKSVAFQQEHEAKLLYSSPIAREERMNFAESAAESRARLDALRAEDRSKQRLLGMVEKNAEAVRRVASPDHMFELDMDAATSPDGAKVVGKGISDLNSPSKGKRKEKANWKKLNEVQPMVASPAVEANPLASSFGVLKGWSSPAVSNKTSKVSLSDIMKETETFSKVEKKSSASAFATPTKKVPTMIVSVNMKAASSSASRPISINVGASAAPSKFGGTPHVTAAANQVPSTNTPISQPSSFKSPALAGSKSWGSPSALIVQGGNGTPSPFALPASLIQQPLHLETPSPTASAGSIKIAVKKSQKDRKRAASSNLLADAATGASPTASTPAWTVPSRTVRAHESSYCQESSDVFDFWSPSSMAKASWNSNCASKTGSLEPSASHPMDISPRPNASKSCTKSIAVVAPKPTPKPATTVSVANPRSTFNRPSLSDIQAEEMIRRNTEVHLREVIKNTSFADIQREEAERKELKELYGVSMVLQNGEWQVVPCDLQPVAAVVAEVGGVGVDEGEVAVPPEVIGEINGKRIPNFPEKLHALESVNLASSPALSGECPELAIVEHRSGDCEAQDHGRSMDSSAIQPNATNFLSIGLALAAIGGGAFVIDHTFNAKEELLDGKHHMYSHLPEHPTRAVIKSNNYVREYLNETYALVGLGVALTGGSAYWLHFNKAFQRTMARNPVGVTLGALVASGLVSSACTFAVTKGIFLTSAIIISPALFAHAGLYTAGLLGSLSWIGCTTKSDPYLYIGGPLLSGLVVSAIAANRKNILPVRLQALPIAFAFYLYGGLAVFGYYVIGDMEKVIKNGREVELGLRVRDPVTESLKLYLDFVLADSFA
ncbi:hypothetical protein BC830DRAFT_1085173 [Chytriomyces sp. MP71]|nr:hypothetical protein BC830DRAFT_1085173 [Chytriomyces sp. MP71]